MGAFLIYAGDDPRARTLETFVTAGEDMLHAVAEGHFNIDKLRDVLGNGLRYVGDIVLYIYI